MGRRAARQPRPNGTLKLWPVVGFLLALYVGIAFTRYRFKHPEKTETQLTLEIVEALLWR